MTVSWIPKRRTIQGDILEEEARLEALKAKPVWQPPIPEIEPSPTFEQPQPVVSPFQPAPISRVAPQIPALAPPALPTAPRIAPPKEEPIDVPFWQRSLEVFAAPFNWVDENIIKPGLAMGVTTLGVTKDVKRKPGEDFFEWKKRSLAAWKTPGFDVNVPWSDDPLRIDLKGVLELAPWLLIPGAGQVGAGVRAARGIAGILGQFGRAGRVLGTMVEYSPWGLVEKTAGAAMRGAFKAGAAALGKTQARIGERLVGKTPELPPPPPEVAELTTLFKAFVVPARKAFEKAKPTELTAKQTARLESVARQHREGKITAIERQALEDKVLEVGSLKAQFAIEGGQFSKEKINKLLEPIYKASETSWEAKDAARALKILLMKGEIPEPRHFKQFAKIYGTEFAQAVKAITLKPRSRWENLIDILNIPRALLASFDLSATGRQGLILSLMHPTKVPRAFWRQLKAVYSEKMAVETDDALRVSPLYKTAVDSGVEFTTLRKGAELVAKEEPFASNFAHMLPGVRRSERGFTTYLNEIRLSSFESSYGSWVAQGAGKTELKMLGKFINFASGRGELPFNLTKYAPIFNTVLFSPRLQAATLQLPRQLGRMLLSKNPYMRKEAARALITFVGGGTALLGLLNASGVSKVELDPRAGDFGKIKIGETRLDIWRGYLQYIRFFAQVATGERKSAYGNMNKAQRDEIAWRFLQSKSSPAFGLMIDLLKGENYMGEPLFEKTTGAIKTARNRFLPIALQDVIDAIEQDGVNGLWTAAPATLGIGVLTYVNDFVRIKERIARQLGFESWDDIDPKTQRQIQNTNVELQVANIEFDRQVMGTAWGDWRLAGKAIEDVFTVNVELATAKYQQSGDGYQYRLDISKSFTARRGGYDARNEEARFEDIVRRNELPDTAEALLALGPEQLAIRTYTEALFGKDMYDEFGDYRFDEAEIRKEQLRRQLGEDMFKYVEEFRGLKYETLPPEYQELVRAKIVLAPYWRVKDNVERLAGGKWPRERMDRAIARLRKIMRRQSRDVEKYYQMFYVRP